MRDRPAGITERDLGHALADGWGIRDLRRRHRRTAGTEHAWQSLEGAIAQVTR